MATLGQTLRIFRKQNGLTQAELAERVNVSGKTVRWWERDYTTPRASDIQKLCEVLNCTEGELLNGPEETEIKVTLDFGKIEKGMNGIMINGKDRKFELRLDTDGAVGIFGMAKFANEEEFKATIAKIADLFREGWETQRRLGNV